MRQDDGVGGRVRQVERAAQGVAQLVVQRHGRGPEHRAAQPGALLGPGPGVAVGGVGDQLRQRPQQRAHAPLGHRRRRGRGIGGPQRLDGVRHRVEPAGHRHVDRQPQGQVGVVEHRDRQHPGVAPGALAAGVGQPPHRGHLRPRVRRGDGDDGQSVHQRDGLAQPDRRPAADRHAPVGPELGGPRGDPVGDGDRHVHPRLGQHRRAAVTQQRGDLVTCAALLRGAQHQHPGQPQVVELGGQLGQRPGAEPHPHGQGPVAAGHARCSVRSKVSSRKGLAISSAAARSASSTSGTSRTSDSLTPKTASESR